MPQDPRELDTGVPHIARVYNYWLGGTDDFPADRAAAEQVMASSPDIMVSVRAQRAFLGRAVRYLVISHPAGPEQDHELANYGGVGRQP